MKSNLKILKSDERKSKFVGATYFEYWLACLFGQKIIEYRGCILVIRKWLGRYYLKADKSLRNFGYHTFLPEEKEKQ